jgi:DNA-binding NarL/FixJ family response regulator
MTTTISIVEDDRDLRESIAQYVGAAPGFQCVSQYASAEEALEHLAQDKPDVVLMDINLDGMSGIECARQLKTEAPAIQILMLTVFDDTEQIFNALAAGASGYLLKRMDPSKLLEAIREVHAGGSPMSGPIARKVVGSFQARQATIPQKASLSPREKEVLECLAQGRAYKQIGDQLGVSIDTIRTYIRRIYEKLHVCSRTEAVAKYLRP